jgi:hypothetical protein
MGNPIGGMRCALPSGDPTNRSGRPSIRLGLLGCGEEVTITKLGSIIGFDSVVKVLKGLPNSELNLKAFKLGYMGGGFEC